MRYELMLPHQIRTAIHSNLQLVLHMTKTISASGPGCVKTSFKSELGPNLPDFKNLRFAKALISLKLNF